MNINQFIKDFQSNANYQDCLMQAMVNQWSCLVQCDNLDGTDLTDCERKCLKELKEEHRNCPCQVLNRTDMNKNRTIIIFRLTVQLVARAINTVAMIQKPHRQAVRKRQQRPLWLQQRCLLHPRMQWH